MPRSLSIFFAALLMPVFSLPSPARWKPEYGQLDPRVQQFIRGLRNKLGEYCCDDADGYRPNDPDIVWDMEKNHYRVHINGEWLSVEDWMIPGKPNIAGRAIVWVWSDGYGFNIRCFLPGAEL
jgi:hypothetical protein